jgi:hypothetical protein
MRPGFLGLFVTLIVTPVLAQQPAPAQRPNELLAGKLLYVAPMDAGLKDWLVDYLRPWGKYEITGNPEGVDLVLKSYKPEKETQWENRAGVPMPKDDSRRTPLSRKKREELPAASFSVVDWVRNEVLWQADVVDRKQKKDEPDPPAGPHTTIFARDMSPDQIAHRVATKLREYVTNLEKGAGSQP